MRDLLLVSSICCLILVSGYSSSNDTDNDGIKDRTDNFPLISNLDQAGIDNVGTGDECDEVTDKDSDLFSDNNDNCLFGYNPDQMASIGNAIFLGDACDEEDEDAIFDVMDNCPSSSNYVQAEISRNGVGDVCESCQKVSLVADIWFGAQSGHPSSLHVLDGKLYFQANDGIIGEGLWAYDPACPTAGVNRVADTIPGSGVIHPNRIIELNGKLHFFKNNELWVYDPEDPTTNASQLFDVNYDFTLASFLAAMDGELYFIASDDTHTGWSALSAYDLADPLAGVLMVADINVTSHAGDHKEHLDEEISEAGGIFQW